MGEAERQVEEARETQEALAAERVLASEAQVRRLEDEVAEVRNRLENKELEENELRGKLKMQEQTLGEA